MLAIDTHTYVNQLVEAGVPEKQARAQVRTIIELMTGDLATKQDVQLAKVELKADIDRQCAALKADIDRQCAALKADIDRQCAALKADIMELKADMDAKINKMTLTVITVLGVLMTILKFVH